MHEKFVIVYDCVYAAVVYSKVATPLDESYYYFINISVRRVKTEEEAACHQINHCLSHPQYVLFGDEVGTDINNMDDGNNGGQHNIRKKGMKTNLLSSKASGYFTLIGMTAETGKSLLCLYIFAAKSLSVTDAKGFGYRASIPYESSNSM